MKKSRRMVFSSSASRQGFNKVVVGVGVGLVLLIGAGYLATRYNTELAKWTSWLPFQQKLERGNQTESTVLSLVSLPATKRDVLLEEKTNSLETSDARRARYLLATDLIEQKQPKKALELLEGLESIYPVIAPYIALKRYQAYQVSGDKTKAENTLQDILKKYPQSAAAGEALFVLGSSNPKLWDRAIAEFPSHPRIQEIIRRRLQEKPNQPQLMLLLVKHSSEPSGITSILDSLVNQNAEQLKSADWEAIAWAYWQNQQYSKAGSAYIAAPETPSNSYRGAKGLDLGGKKAVAVNAYEYVLVHFPQAPEAASSLLGLANLSQPEEALQYLDRVISQFPDRAGEALNEKAKIFDKMNNPEAAAKARQLLITQYGNSEVVAEYRWNLAWEKIAAKDLPAAWQAVQLISSESPKSKYAPRAAFWVGKLANKLGHEQEAKAAFEHTLAQYPQSYYAWRSAVFLGWNVGDFTTVRGLTPQVVRQSQRDLPPAGSATFQELYQLGQDQDAWTVWQTEFHNRIQPTVAEQFTNGLILQAIGKSQEGIAQISKLEDRETPAEQAQFQALKQQTAYWQALYPFPYMDIIEKWSQQYQINPLLVVGLIRQESRFEPVIRSTAGAVGLMQVLPSTANWGAKKINLNQYSLDNPNDNVNLGTWFLDQTHRQYNNNSMLAVASYNAGPGNVSKWLKEKGAIDPDEFVETIPFKETRGYVKNVFGNYWNYLRLYSPEFSQKVGNFATAKPQP